MLSSSSSQTSGNGSGSAGKAPSISSHRKRCRVCGDVALAFNFNGLSCESCKAFFRRNALDPQKLKCTQPASANATSTSSSSSSSTTANNNKRPRCEINKLSRRKCSHCRMAKCLEIGMRPELLLTTHEEKSHKRRKAVVLPSLSSQTAETASPSPQTPSPAKSVLSLKRGSSSSASSSCDASTIAHPHLPSSSTSPVTSATPTPTTTTTTTHSDVEEEGSESSRDVCCLTSRASSPEEELEDHNINDHDQDPDDPDSDNSNRAKGTLEQRLGPHELVLLREVRASVFYDTTENVNGEALDFGHVFRLQEYYITEMVNFCNQFEAFRCLPAPDKLIRIKGSFIELLLLRAAFYYVRDRDGFTMKANHSGDHYVFVGLREILSPLRDQVLVDEFRTFLISFFEELEEDEDLKDLMGVILVFRTRNRHLQRSDYIRYQCCVYSHLLQRYLEAKYGSSSSSASIAPNEAQTTRTMDKPNKPISPPQLTVEETAQSKHRALMRHLEVLGHFKRVFSRLFARLIDDIDGGIAHALAEIYHLNAYCSE